MTKSTMQTDTVLSVRQLATGYHDLRVVWDVSFDVRPGELTVLLGRNGAGKTTTLRAISGLNSVSEGSILFNGQDVTQLSPHARVKAGMAYVQEGKCVFHQQTVEQNLVLGGYSRKLSRSKLRQEAEYIYDLFPILAEKRTLLAGSMSGGQQQMLAIGQALMARPKLLLLDEPSGGLAPVIVNEVMERIETLKKSGLAILLIEQAVEASVRLADHVAVLDMGRVAFSARRDDISDMDVLFDAYFGRSVSPAS